MGLHEIGADARLRAVERQVAANPGDIQARVALLRERLRAGLITPDRLQIAVYLGDLAAQQAATETGIAPCAPSDPDDLPRLVEGLARWGIEPPVRAALGLARSCAASSAAAELLEEQRQAVTECLGAVESWQPTNRRRKAVAHAVAALSKLTWARDDERTWSLIISVAAAGHAASKREAGEAGRLAAKCAWDVARIVGREEARAAVARAVLPWALGDSCEVVADPGAATQPPGRP